MKGKHFDSTEEIDRFLNDYREQRNLEYHLWRLKKFGIPLPKRYKDMLNKRRGKR